MIIFYEKFILSDNFYWNLSLALNEYKFFGGGRFIICKRHMRYAIHINNPCWIIYSLIVSNYSNFLFLNSLFDSCIHIKTARILKEWDRDGQSNKIKIQVEFKFLNITRAKLFFFLWFCFLMLLLLSFLQHCFCICYSYFFF